MWHTKGAAAGIVLLGGIRSGMGLCRFLAANLQELHENAQFIEMSGAGLKRKSSSLYKQWLKLLWSIEL